MNFHSPPWSLQDGEHWIFSFPLECWQIWCILISAKSWYENKRIQALSVSCKLFLAIRIHSSLSNSMFYRFALHLLIWGPTNLTHRKLQAKDSIIFISKYGFALLISWSSEFTFPINWPLFIAISNFIEL